MNKRVYRNYLLLSFLCVGCITFINLYYNEDQFIETKSITVNYFDPTSENSVIYNYSIMIIKPLSKRFNENSSLIDKYPAVIILHGDNVDSIAMSNLKIEFLENNYAVVLLDADFKYTLFFELNSTLDYLLTRTDIDHSRIGILGHSRGANYAYHFGRMRNDSINAVVCTNFGPLGKFYVDYFEYFTRFIDTDKIYDKKRFLNEYNFSETENSPRNLLLLSNDYEPNLQTSEYYYNRELELWKLEEFNTFYGDFENGSARELTIQKSIFFHTSGIIDPKSIYKQVSWMNNGLIYSNFRNSYDLVLLRNLISGIMLFLAISLSIIIGSKLIAFLPNIVLSLSFIVFIGITVISLTKSPDLIMLIFLLGITGSIILAITRKEKYWQIKKKYTNCNFVIKRKLYTKREEIFLKTAFFSVFFAEISFFIYILSNPDFVHFWIIFILYILFVLPYQYQYFFNQFQFSKKDKQIYLEMISNDSEEKS